MRQACAFDILSVTIIELRFVKASLSPVAVNHYSCFSGCKRALEQGTAANTGWKAISNIQLEIKKWLTQPTRTL